MMLIFLITNLTSSPFIYGWIAAVFPVLKFLLRNADISNIKNECLRQPDISYYSQDESASPQNEK